MFWKTKTALVLGGGGVRGFFHMGVIKGLQQLEVKIDEISGTSIGAVVGLIYAANPKIDFEKITKELDFFKLIQDITVGSRWKTEVGLEKFLKKYIGTDNFGDLKIKMKFNATDVNSYKEVIFEKGKIFPALLASIAIPGVFPPLKIDGKFLVDGGVINNIPVPLVDDCQRIIVSDISGPIKKIDEKSQPTDIFYSSIALMQKDNSLQKIEKKWGQKLIFLNLEDSKTFILDFRKKNYQYLIDLVYEAVMRKRLLKK